MKNYFNSLMRRLTPADIFIFSVFAVFQLVLYWWFRKLLFITAFLLLLTYYIIYYAVFKIELKPLLHSLDTLDLSALLFGGALILTTAFSEYRSFSVGLLFQQEGLIIFLIYIAAFIVLRRAVHFSRRHFYVFIATGVVVCALAVPVFFGVLPILEPPKALTTYTNVDMLTQVLILYFAVNFLLWLNQSDRIIRIFHFFANLLFMFVAIITQCDGIILFLAAFFIILPFTVKIDLAVIRQTAICTAEFFFALALFNIFGKYAVYNPALLIDAANKIPFYISAPIAAVILFAALQIKTNRKKDLTKIFRWGIPSVLIFGIAVAFIFFRAPLYNYYNLYGGSRTDFIKTVFAAYTKFFSPVNKLFGTGMHTFGKFLITNCPHLIPENLPLYLLYPHNFILELIFETGAVGFITCAAFLTMAIKKAVNQKNALRQIALIAVVLYLITRLFYIPSPEVTPIALLLLAGCCPALKKTQSGKKRKV